MLRASTLPAALLLWAAEEEDAPFIQVWHDRAGVVQTVTSSELAEEMLSAATYLDRACGVGSGDHVALLAHNSVAYLCMALGAMTLGASSVHLNWRLPLATTLTLLEGMRPRILCASDPFLEDAGSLCAALPCMRLVALPSPSAPPCPEIGQQDAVKLAATLLDPRLNSRAAGAKVASVFVAGGSTGRPKLVPHTHTSMLWLCDQLLRHTPEPFADDVPHRGTLSFAPFYEVDGFVAHMVFNLHARCRALIMLSSPPPERIGARLLLSACATLRPSVVSASPDAVEELAQYLRQPLSEGLRPASKLLSSLHLLRCAFADGGPAEEALSSECVTVLAAHSVKVCASYVQTELGGPVLFGSPGGDPHLFRPLNGIRLQLRRVDPSHDRASSGASGGAGGGATGGGGDDGNVGELVLLGCHSATRGYLAYPGADGPPAPPQPLHQAASKSATVEFQTADRFRIETRADGEWARLLRGNAQETLAAEARAANDETPTTAPAAPAERTADSETSGCVQVLSLACPPCARVLCGAINWFIRRGQASSARAVQQDQNGTATEREPLVKHAA
jgi:acyl-CoA synthetase (AMP-forming)/AMP-acid ligase II